MSELEIRDMTTADIDVAAELYRSGGWEDRRGYLETILANPTCAVGSGFIGGDTSTAKRRCCKPPERNSWATFF